MVRKLLLGTICVALCGFAFVARAAEEAGRSNDPASAEKRAPGSISAPDKGAPMTEPGRSDDPASAEKRSAGTLPPPNKGEPSHEPGRENDPASAEKQNAR